MDIKVIESRVALVEAEKSAKSSSCKRSEGNLKRSS